MNLSRFRVRAQLGAGPDGARYEAVDASTGGLVELCLLAGARADPHRWSTLAARLRLAALLDHPTARAVLNLGLEESPPYLVRAAARNDPGIDALRARLPLREQETVALAQRLADVLAEAHRLGLVHGCLGPAHIGVNAPDQLQLDFTGLALDVASPLGSTTEVDEVWFAPEAHRGEPPRAPTDIFALGALICWLLGEPAGPESNRDVADPDGQAATVHGLGISARTAQSQLGKLIGAMRAIDPADRPTARSVAEQLQTLSAFLATPTVLQSQQGSPLAATLQFTKEDDAPGALQSVWSRDRLGRYRLLDKLGQGGMGAVFRAEDLSDGSVVAIKVLRPDLAARPESLRRFQKEARLLAEIHNPFVTNLLEVNEDDGIHFLALDFVDGESLAHRLEERGKLDSGEALEILAQVARALEEAHLRGIVHRDVKPQNILLIGRTAAPGSDGSGPEPDATPRVKLSDFGLARHAVQSESLQVTQSGAILGTPLYMAPEQCAGNQVSPATDVYAMGCTLFHMLAGRPPFLADTPLAVIAKHNNEPPPALKSLNPEVSDGICEVVNKALSKPPGHRYGDAGSMLRDLERLLRGEPTNLAIHPLLPAFDPDELIIYNWTWELNASARQLWPLVSNTERLNRAVGLPAVHFSMAAEPGRPPRRMARFRKAGMNVAWEEHAFEWVEGRRMGVLREYSEGPWKWLTSEVELAPRAEGGTLLNHRIRIAPRGLMGRAITAVQVGKRSYPSLDKVYRRIDAALTGRLPAQADPFEEALSLSRAQRARLETGLDRLIERGVDVNVVERFGDFLATAPAQEVARIRPLALANRLGLDAEQVITACLHGAHDGLLVLLWDILCPICRNPSEIRETLRTLRDHGRCEACNLDYELDFGNAIELIFRASPELRTTELGTYCIGGPAHFPHVAAQARIRPGERLELALELDEGEYRLRGPQLPFAHEFAVRATAATSRCELNLARRPAFAPEELHAGGQVFDLVNDHDQELLVRIERVAPRTDALTAARASSLALFRELFPGEVLSPGQVMPISTITLLVTEIEGDLYAQGDDQRTFRVLHELFQTIAAQVKRQRGALVKTVGEGTLSVFPDPLAALQAALEVAPAVAQQEHTRTVLLKMAIHRGVAMAATLNDHLDYFGQTVNQATRLAALCGPGELLLSPEVATDQRVVALLQARGLDASVISAPLAGLSGWLVSRIVLAGSGP